MNDLKQGSMYALTTDTWTSVACNNYVTVTAHFFMDWKFKSYVLATTCSNERHTAENLKEHLDGVIDDWALTTRYGIYVTTDNAANIVLAVNSSKHDLKHIGCFAHTLNLAVQKGMKTRAVDNILGHVKRIVSYFRRSTAAHGVLTDKQKQLEKKNHSLINEVSTRWNSAVTMLSRFEEQRDAVYAALVHLKNNDLLQALSRVNSEDVDAVVKFLEPFKTVTEIMSGESYCTVSLIKPILQNLLSKCQVSIDEPKILTEMKMAVLEDLIDRYQDPGLSDLLHKCTFMDPRFKTVKDLSDEDINKVYQSLQEEMCTDSPSVADDAEPSDVSEIDSS